MAQRKAANLEPTRNWVKEAVAYWKIQLLPLDVLWAGTQLPLQHKDPFDRALVGHAQVLDLIVLTPDPLIQQYNVNYLW